MSQFQTRYRIAMREAHHTWQYQSYHLSMRPMLTLYEEYRFWNRELALLAQVEFGGHLTAMDTDSPQWMLSILAGDFFLDNLPAEIDKTLARIDKRLERLAALALLKKQVAILTDTQQPPE